MDYLNLSLKEIYSKLDSEDKIIVNFFENFPNFNKNEIISLGLDLPTSLSGNAEDAWREIVEFNLSKIKAEMIKEKSFSKQDKVILSKLTQMKDIYKFARFKDELLRDGTLLWYIAKSETFKINPEKFKNIFNGYFEKSNGQEKVIIPFAKKVNPKYYAPKYEVGYYKKILLNKLLKYPHLKEETFSIYKAIKDAGFLDINAVEAKTKGKINGLKGSWNGQQQSIFHLALKGLPKSKPLLDVLFEFEDLDVNAKNPVIIVNYLNTKNLENETDGADISKNNSPIMQIFRMSEVLDENLTKEVIDKLIERGAELDYKNYRGESAVMTAIHHGCTYGVEKARHLLYPEILKDMENLQGFCEWGTLKPEISKILSKEFPDMKDANNQTYFEFLNNLKEQLSINEFVKFMKIMEQRKISKQIEGCLDFGNELEIKDYSRKIADNIKVIFEKCDMGDIYYNAWVYRKENGIIEPTEEVVLVSVSEEYRNLLLMEKALIPERYAKHLKQLQDKIGIFKKEYCNPDIPF